MPRSHCLVATFGDADALVRAVHAVRQEQFRIYDVYSPYPIHGLDEAMGIRRSRLPWVTLIVGLSALANAALFQFYAAVADWPLNVGGKPDNSSLAFVPITFETTVLLGGLSTVLALFVRARLFPGKREKLVAEGITDDVFALVLRERDSRFNARRAHELLVENGAENVEEKEAEL